MAAVPAKGVGVNAKGFRGPGKRNGDLYEEKQSDYHLRRSEYFRVGGGARNEGGGGGGGGGQDLHVSDATGDKERVDSPAYQTDLCGVGVPGGG